MSFKRRKHSRLFVGFLFSLSLVQSGFAAGSYHLLKEIPLSGEGGWDYLSIDATARRLYVTHSTKIVVIDLEKDAVAGEIPGTPGVHGFALAPELGRGFSTNGAEAKVSIVDLKTLKTLAKTETGENPDAIVFEPKRQEVFAFNGRGFSATVLDARSGKVTATLPLPGKPEFAVADPEARRVYCNIEDKSEVVALDTSRHEIVATWPLAPGEEPTGMAVDLAQHRLFIGCQNKLMVMMDNTNGKIISTIPIGAGVDATAFDPATRLVFSSNGEGNVTIAKEETPEKITAVQTLQTERGARTMALDPVTHKIYLASAKFEPLPAASAGAPRQRPKIIPNSFKILVYGMAD